MDFLLNESVLCRMVKVLSFPMFLKMVKSAIALMSVYLCVFLCVLFRYCQKKMGSILFEVRRVRSRSAAVGGNRRRSDYPSQGDDNQNRPDNRWVQSS